MSYKRKKMKKKSTRNRQHNCFTGGESDESDTELLEYSRTKQSAVNMPRQEETSSTAEDATQRDIKYWRKKAADELKSARQTQLKYLDGTHTTICIDVSNSMNQNNAWEQTKAFFTEYMSGMKEEFAKGMTYNNTALVTFGNTKLTKVHHRLTTEFVALERLMDNITPGGPSPLLAGLILAKASATVSYRRFVCVNNIYVPPKIIVVTDGKTTNVNEVIELYEQEHHTSAHEEIISEIKSMKEEEDIDIDFVYVGSPDIVFLHDLRAISGGQLMPHTSGRFFAKYIGIKCNFKKDKINLDLMKQKHEVQGTLGDNGAEGHRADNIRKTSVPSEDIIPRDITYWRKTAADELKSARKTQLKYLMGSHTTICIDVSESMRQNNAWEETKTFLTDYVSGMREEFAKGFDYHNTALVTFGHATKIHSRLTKDLIALERIMENITPGGSSPLLAGLILAKTSVTVSNYRFAKRSTIWVPPRIIVVTDGKVTDVSEVNELYDQDQNVKQLIIDEIKSMKEEEDIDIDFVYVGNPDIVFLHELRGFSGGELKPHSSGRFFAKYVTIQCILQNGHKQIADPLIQKGVENETEFSLVDNEAKRHHGDKKAYDLVVEDEAGASKDAIQRDITFWRKTAADKLKSARQTQLQYLMGSHTTICIDVSESMKQNNGWEETKTFLTDYVSGMREEFSKGNDYHNTALVTFGHATKVQHPLTKDFEALERIIENITLGGPSPLLAGLILAKASATVSHYRFANVDNMYVPPKLIVVTDGKATNVKNEYDQEHHESANEVKQLIIDEIKSMKKEKDIDIDFVYVGNPDIVFLHHLRGISGGELMPHTSGRFLAKYIAIKCMFLADENKAKLKHEVEGTPVDNEAGGHHVNNIAEGPFDDNEKEGHHSENKVVDGLGGLIPKEGLPSVDTIQRDMKYWRKTAADELESAKQTQLKTLMGTHTTICIDVSDSMRRNEAWEQTKTFLTEYMSEMTEEFANGNKHHNIALVTFGHVTKIHHHLTKDLTKLERIMENITPGGSSPLLAGLVLAKASVTVSNYPFASMNNIHVPPRIIVVTDGKATDVDDVNELYDQNQNESAHEVKQLIIDEIKNMKEEENIDIDFVYVGNPDIVFLHKLRGISEGELKPNTSGRFFAKYITIKRMFKEDQKDDKADMLKPKGGESEDTDEENEEEEVSEDNLERKAKKVEIAIINQQMTIITNRTEDSSLVTNKIEDSSLEQSNKEIDDLFKYDSEETVLRVFSDRVDTHYLKYRDQKGRTLLHRAVERDFLHVADLLINYGCNPLSYDSSKQTPLHIAFENGFDEMAALIFSKLKNFVVRRMFGDIESTPGPLEATERNGSKKRKKTENNVTQICGTYDEQTVEPMFKIEDLIEKKRDKTLLQVFDSFVEEQPDGLSNVHVKLLDTDDNKKKPTDNEFDVRKTAFQRLTKLKKKDALNHPVVRVYVEHMWKNWCQTRFLFYGCLYLLSLFCLTYSAVTGVTAPDVYTYDTSLQYSRAVMEVISYLYALAVLFTEIRQILRHMQSYFDHFFNFMELLSSILVILVLPLRYTYLRAHWYVFALGYLLWAIRIFKYATVSSQFGVYVEVVKRVLVKDFVQFSILLLVINIMFSGTFLLVLKADDSIHTHIDTSSFQGILYVGIRTLIEAGPIVDYTGLDGYRVIGTIIMIVYMFFTIVVMLNILIAQLTETYTTTHKDCKRTVRTNRACIIARAQRNHWKLFTFCWGWKKNYRDTIESQNMKKFKKYSSTLDVLSREIEIMRRKQITNDLDVKTIKRRQKEAIDKKVLCARRCSEK